MARLILKVNKSPLEYLENPISNTFYLFPITPSAVETQISNYGGIGKDWLTSYLKNLKQLLMRRRRDLFNNLTIKNCDKVEKFKKFKIILVKSLKM